MEENKKTNKLSIVAGIILILDFIFSIFCPMSIAKIGIAIIILVALLAIILSIVGKIQIKRNNEKGKGLAITCMVLGIILFVYACLSEVILFAIEDISFNDSIICEQAYECKDNNDGTSTCKFSEFEIPCSTKLLTSEQFK